MKFLGTGCVGFVGRHIVKRLLDVEYEVRIFNNYSTRKRENSIPVNPNNQFEFFEANSTGFQNF